MNVMLRMLRVFLVMFTMASIAAGLSNRPALAQAGYTLVP